MARDPVCGMHVEESENSIMHEIDGMKYYFCSSSCLHEFLAPDKEIKEIKKRIIIGIALLIPIVILTYIEILPKAINNYVLFALTTPVQLWIGWRFYEGMRDAIKHRIINMYVLISIGTTTAWLYSSIVTFMPNLFPFKDTYFETSAAIIVALLIGNYLEEKSKAKATNTIRRLFDLKPRAARVIKDGIERKIPVEKVKVNDIIIVKNGEKIPVDGVIVEGNASIDQSPITGESIPVEKGVGDEVIGGTINKLGVIKFKATKVGKDTVLSQVIKVVEEARSSKVPIQRLADKVSAYFVPVVLTVAIAAALGWYFLGSIEIPFAILIAVTVLIVACPCALGIATPVALVAGTSKAAENGILVKDGSKLEVAKKIDAVVFDKTGTLTTGEPIVKDIIPLGEQSRNEILRLSAIAERWSEHPLGKAIVNKAKEEGIIVSEPDSFKTLTGVGVIANYAGHTILVGSKKLMEENGIIVDKIKSEEKTILVAIDNRHSGIITIEEKVKDGAEEVIRILKGEGVEPIMLTGDSEKRARVIANRLDIDNVIAEVLPHQKADVVKRLKKEGRVVAMVGDGINDAPALEMADLGIAIGSGTDIAKESGGIILLKDDIRDVVTALDIGKKTVAKVRQNLFWAFAYNSALIPIAAGALIPIFGIEIYRFLPFLAAAAMGLSDATVVSNSLLLNRYRPRFKSDNVNIESDKSIVSMEVIDPVCKMKIDSSSAIKLEHGSKTYYFCREECKEEFIKEPQKYAR